MFTRCILEQLQSWTGGNVTDKQVGNLKLKSLPGYSDTVAGSTWDSSWEHNNIITSNCAPRGL